MLVTQVVCVRAAKFDQPTSRIDFCGSPSFPVEMEIKKAADRLENWYLSTFAVLY